MNINVSIVDQQVRGLAVRLQAMLEEALDKPLDETTARSVAFVVHCEMVMLDLTEDEALANLTEGGNDFGVDAIDVRTNRPYIEPLRRFFRMREKRR